MHPRFIAAIITATAALLVVVGGLLLIMPIELAQMLGWSQQPGTPIALSLLGATLVGFGATNWIVRRAPLGGIYGRAVVVGNQVHFVVGTLLLLNEAMRTGTAPPLWLAVLLYGVGAAFFSALLLRGPRT